MIELPWPPASLSGNHWRADEIATLRRVYEAAVYRGDLEIDALAVQLGRAKSSISRKAASLGLADPRRPRRTKPKVDRRKFKTAEERSAALSARMVALHRERGHPMAGKKHTAAARARMSEASNGFWNSLTGPERSQHVNNVLKAAIAKNGRIGPLVNKRETTWKAGWREIGGYRKYYRSRWEANYARYLNWLQHKGEILDWKHEPETFWFEGIKRGVRSYLPDFRVWEMDGSSRLHEVKGWMDARSKTTLKRMAKYYPGETIILIKEKDYRAVVRAVGGLIEGWE